MSGSLRHTITRIILIGLAGFLILSSDGLAQEGVDSLFFPETGHTVPREFVPFFRQYGGLQVFGYPITEIFFYEPDGRYVQYYQNCRLEIELPGRVFVSALPLDLHQEKREPRLEPNQVPLDATYYPLTGHSVRMSFLDFYLAHGGPQVFGYPITELLTEHGRQVQYFERVKFEWWPELPNGFKVQLARMGEYMFHEANLDDVLLNPIARVETTGIHLAASVQTAVMTREGESKRCMCWSPISIRMLCRVPM